MACAEIGVEVVYAAASQDVRRRSLTLPAGSTVADALRLSGLWTEASPVPVHVGIWGRRCGEHTLLRDLDRVELYRPLRIDPKEARRQRGRRTSRPLKKPPR